MQVKGSVVKTIDRFVMDRYPKGYENWKNTLQEESKKIYTNSIMATDWYPVNESLIEPTEKMCSMFFKDAYKGAWESGNYSAHIALTGIYKVFVLISSPSFLMKRASKILSSFYQPAEINVVENTPKSMKIHITQLPTKNALVEHRIGGWMQGALEICGCKGLVIDITASMAKGNGHTAYEISWE